MSTRNYDWIVRFTASMVVLVVTMFAYEILGALAVLIGYYIGLYVSYINKKY